MSALVAVVLISTSAAALVYVNSVPTSATLVISVFNAEPAPVQLAQLSVRASGRTYNLSTASSDYPAANCTVSLLEDQVDIQVLYVAAGQTVDILIRSLPVEQRQTMFLNQQDVGYFYVSMKSTSAVNLKVRTFLLIHGPGVLRWDLWRAVTTLKILQSSRTFRAIA
jgi:hypothetical protein